MAEDLTKLPPDEAGCSRRECRNGHTHRWGRCAYGIEPPPTLSRFDVVLMPDGHPSGVFTNLSVEEVADWLREQGYTVTRPPSLDQGSGRDPLHDAVQLLLINHHHELLKPAGEQDPEIAELAAVYQQLTGWDALEEIREDVAGDKAWPAFATGEPEVTTADHEAAHARLEESFKDASTWTQEAT